MGYTRDGTGPHGRGLGPGKGQASCRTTSSKRYVRDGTGPHGRGLGPGKGQASCRVKTHTRKVGRKKVKVKAHIRKTKRSGRTHAQKFVKLSQQYDRSLPSRGNEWESAGHLRIKRKKYKLSIHRMTDREFHEFDRTGELPESFVKRERRQIIVR